MQPFIITFLTVSGAILLAILTGQISQPKRIKLSAGIASFCVALAIIFSLIHKEPDIPPISLTVQEGTPPRKLDIDAFTSAIKQFSDTSLHISVYRIENDETADLLSIDLVRAMSPFFKTATMWGSTSHTWPAEDGTSYVLVGVEVWSSSAPSTMSAAKSIVKILTGQNIAAKYYLKTHKWMDDITVRLFIGSIPDKSHPMN